jgi:parallel beta-helix repeat protein
MMIIRSVVSFVIPSPARRPPSPKGTDRVPNPSCWTRGAPESLTLSPFSALKGQRNVGQGKRLSAPPWVEVPSELAPLLRLEVPRYGKVGSQDTISPRGGGLVVSGQTQKSDAHAKVIMSSCIFWLTLLMGISCNSRADRTSPDPGRIQARTVTVAQTGQADVLGSDDVALQKAADTLRPGDTLMIGPGTYQMNNSLFVPSGVTVRGTVGRTILHKSSGVESLLIQDGDYGESQLTVAEPQKFRPGMGLTVMDDTLNSGWDVSVTRVTAVEGNILRIDPMTLRDYDAERQHAKVRNIFPILCAIETENVVFEDLIVDGNKQENSYIDGCRGGAIYLYKSRNATIRNCIARNYNGDGISFQITDNVQVLNCESCGHTGYGVHPGTGSPHALVKGCRLHDNGQIGLFLCWRVRDGHFEDNVITNNGKYGISIGHKDTDNLFANNTITGNGFCGVYFREESFKNSGHRNTFRSNIVTDNGDGAKGYGFYVEPHAGEILIASNRIAETRSGNQRTQRYGVYKMLGAGQVQLESNTMEGHTEADYFEGKQGH